MQSCDRPGPAFLIIDSPTLTLEAAAHLVRVLQSIQPGAKLAAPATDVGDWSDPARNEKLRPKLFKELKPGTRVVSHAVSMGDAWPPEKTLDVNGRNVYFWTIPANAAGRP